MSPIKKAFVKIEQMERQLLSLQREKTEAIAIVGMACRFPGGANTPSEFWQNLVNGRDAIVDVPAERWSKQQYYSATRGEAGKIACTQGGFIASPDQFDAGFFGISPREADLMDPQHRLALELAWEALENANIPVSDLYGSNSGVFLGISTYDYYRQLATNLSAEDISAYIGTGNSKSAAAGRIAYCLGLTGPAIAYDTACSSSLVAIEAAVESLRHKKCDLAIVGGVNLMLCPSTSIGFSQAQMLASNGRCKTFADSADGYGRGEGCGMVVLQRLTTAQQEQRTVLAQIRGVGVNQDGPSGGLTVPNGPAQQNVMRRALKNGELSAEDVSYIEAHGTGTPLGDPIELGALAAVYGKDKNQDDPLYVASLKTNVGHMEAAAGIGGLIKVVLCLMHSTIVPHLHCEQKSQKFPWRQLPLSIPQTAVAWKPSNGKKIAGISSFGFAGTNAHILVEEAPIENILIKKTEESSTYYPVTLNAKSETALFALVEKYIAYLQDNPSLNIADFAFTTNMGRDHFNHRMQITTDSVADCLAKLLNILNKRQSLGSAAPQSTALEKPNKVAFLFTGQGSQYAAMGKELYHTQSGFRTALDQCHTYLEPHLDIPLLELLFTECFAQDLNQTAYAQPALFAIGYSLARLWQHWGITPSLVMGHSVGEYIAACLAGIFSLQDGLKLICARGKLMQSLPSGGKMLSIAASGEEVENLLSSYPKDIAIAAYNGPQQTVVSGCAVVVDQLCRTLQDQNIRCTELNVSHAFHSPLMEPIIEDFRSIAKGIQYTAPTIPIISNVSGKLMDAAMANGDYWVQHIRLPVNFQGAIQCLVEQDIAMAIELGSHPTLSSMAQQCMAKAYVKRDPAAEPLWLSTLRRGQSDNEMILQTLGECYVRRATIDWRAVNKDSPGELIQIPLYPFQRKRFHFSNILADTARSQADLVGIVKDLAKDSALETEHSIADYCYKREWQSAALSNQPIEPEAILNTWIVFDDGKGIGENLLKQLRDSGRQCYCIHWGEHNKGLQKNNHYTVNSLENLAEIFQLISQYESQSNHSNIVPIYEMDNAQLVEKQHWGVVYLWGMQEADKQSLSYKTVKQVTENNAHAFIKLVQQLKTMEQVIDTSLWLVTGGVQSIVEFNTDRGLLQSPLWGLGQSLLLEQGDLLRSIIDINKQDPSQSAKNIYSEICLDSEETQIAYNQGQRYVARIIKATKIAESTTKTLVINDQAYYLITGGLGVLGLEIVQWLVNRGAKHIALISRGKPTAEVQSMVAALGEQGVEILTVTGDISDRHTVSELFERLHANHRELKGIIHAAGVLDDGLIEDISLEQLQKVFAPKISGAWLLHEHTRDINLDFFVLFSSAASFLGSAGQANYAAANAFLDTLAIYRRAQGLVASSIHWGPWQAKGMANRLQETSKARLQRLGIQALEKDLCLELLAKLLIRKEPLLAVLDMDWSRFASALDPRQQSILSNLLQDSKEENKEKTCFQQLMAQPHRERESTIEAFLIATLKNVLRLTENELQPQINFIELGMDSLLVMEVVKAIKAQCQLTVYPRELHEHPTLESMVKYLTLEFNQQYGDASIGVEEGLAEKVAVKEKAAIQPALELSTATHFTAIAAEKRLSSAVFLLSSPRAGSTLLRSMLAGHRALFSPPELHLLPYETMAERANALSGSHMDEGLLRALMEIYNLSAEESLERVERYVKEKTPIYDIYRALLEGIAGRYLIDKSPTYASSPQALQQAENLFADAKYIHLIRHPYAVIESFARMRMDKLIGYQGVDSFDVAEQVWQQSNRNIQEFFASRVGSHRCYTLNYESLVAQPEKTMGELCDFLGIDFEPALLTPYAQGRMNDGVHRQSLAIGDPNFLQHNTIDSSLATQWQSIKLPRKLRAETVELSAQFNYELPLENKSRESTANTSVSVAREEKRISVNGLDYCLSSWGKANNPIVLCLHGILDQGPIWQDIALALVEQGYYVVAPDLRGHGLSAHSGPETAPQLLDLVADMDVCVSQLLAATDQTQVTVLAHSMGTIVAAMLAACRPEEIAHLCLVEPVLPSQEQTNVVEQLRVRLKHSTLSSEQRVVFNHPEQARERMQYFYPTMSKELLSKLCERVLKTIEGGFSWCWDQRLGDRSLFNSTCKRDEYLGILSSLSIPIVVMQGDKSDFNRQQDVCALQESLSTAVFHTYAGSHGLHYENPRLVANTLLEFIHQPNTVLPSKELSGKGLVA